MKVIDAFGKLHETEDAAGGHLMTKESFLEDVKHHYLIDYDGMGEPAKLNADGVMEVRPGKSWDNYVYPSDMKPGGKGFPEGYTHIMWYNR